MADFKLCIANPKTGKSYQKEAKGAEAQAFIGLNVGENVAGDGFGMAGYEFQITGGSDYCGFPMRHGILGLRKSIHSSGGVGFRGLKKGEKSRKTVCGHKINEKITQINLKVLKEGSKKVEDYFVTEKKEGEESPKEKKEAPKAE
ncbi:MAG: 30S ribosomal protein S6e [Nanoarchaeota archaeon]|nr:30S ribosomal protein S6e [Nanoarchaeota archaeon]